MDHTEISEEILAIAESVGLSEEDARALLSGDGDMPTELQEVLDRVGDGVSAQFTEE